MTAWSDPTELEVVPGHRCPVPARRPRSEGTWSAQVNDLVGGWIVTSYPRPYSSHDFTPNGDPTKTGRVMADCYGEEEAELIARLLNEARVPACDLPTPSDRAPERCGRCGQPLAKRPDGQVRHVVALGQE